MVREWGGRLLLGGLGAGAAACVVVLVGHLVHGDAAVADLVSDRPTGAQDFTAFRDSAVALLRGGDVYALPTPASLPSLGPPLLPVLLAPLGLLTPLAGYRLLAVVTLLCVVGSAAVVARSLRVRPAAAVAVLAGVLSSTAVLSTLRFGQVYGLLAALLTAAWWAGRRDLPVVEGALLAVLVVLKPSLAPVLLLLVVRRRGRALVSAAVVGAVAVLAPLLLTGPGALATWLRLLTTRLDPMLTYPANVSLPGTLARLTTENPWAPPVLVVPGGAWVGTALGLAAVVASALAARERRAGDPALLALAAAGLLASPVTWSTYLVVLVPGVVVLAARTGPAVVAVLGPAVLLSSLDPTSASPWVRLVLVAPLLLTWAGLQLLAATDVVWRPAAPRAGPSQTPAVPARSSSARSSASMRSTASPASGPL
ncbi:hypothetical protein GCM10027047_16230 [Rhodococcus aerolatus]